jgi:predicted Fe-S protein YdhL (DUF1289 family)
MEEIKEWGLVGDERRRAILRNAERRREDYQKTAVPVGSIRA